MTRTAGDPAGMVRFVLDPSGTVTPDIRRNLPGRGVWVTGAADRVAEAVTKRAFARGFKQAVTAPEALASDVERLLEQAALQRLAIASKAGLVTAGFEKVRAALKSGQSTAVVCASDAAEDGRQKVAALAKMGGHRHKAVTMVDGLSSAALESVLGRERVVHVALAPGRPSDLFLADALRLHAYRTGERIGAEPPHNTDEHVFAGPQTI